MHLSFSNKNYLGTIIKDQTANTIQTRAKKISYLKMETIKNHTLLGGKHLFLALVCILDLCFPSFNSI